MSGITTIDWARYSWNPIRARRTVNGKVRLGHHCEHASPGCIPCYAEGQNKRWGTKLPFTPQARAELDEIYVDDKALFAPMEWTEPGRVFVCSMTDLFGGFVPDGAIHDVHAIIDACLDLTFLTLTKRETRQLGYALDEANTRPGGVRPNVWRGVSVEDVRRLERLDALRRTPAVVRFVSIEPLMEDIADAIDLTGIDWVIIGGRSGTIRHPLELAWIYRLVERCRRAGVAVFVKQLGLHVRDGGKRLRLKSRKGSDPAEWPEDLRIREFPTPRPSYPLENRA